MERQRNLVMNKTQWMMKDHMSITNGESSSTTRSTPSLYKAKDIIPSSWNYTSTHSTVTTTANSNCGTDGGDHNSNKPNHHQQQQDYLTGGFSWPPRSYTCSFCKREFRSAQALGGHMNVHRRDRARLRQSPPPPPPLDHHHQHHHNYPILNLSLNNPNPNTIIVNNNNNNNNNNNDDDFSSSPSLHLVSPLSPGTAMGRHEESRRSWAPIEGRVLDHLHDPPAGRVVIPDHLSKVGTRKSLFGGDHHHYSSSPWCDHRGLTIGQGDGANKCRKRGGDRFHNNVTNVSLELEIGVIAESKNHNHDHEQPQQQQQLDLELRLGI